MTLAECSDNDGSRRLFKVIFPDSLALRWLCPHLRFMTLPFLETENLLERDLIVFIFFCSVILTTHDNSRGRKDLVRDSSLRSE